MDEVRDNLLVLVVGHVDPWLMTGHAMPETNNTMFCTYDDLTEKFLLDLKPDVILSTLVCAYFDMMELAIKLDQLNYEGRVRAITTPLPDPDLILREIRFECPALDFDLIEVTAEKTLRCV